MQNIDHNDNPFPGLRPFESSETQLFFGRDGQSEELLRRLKRTRFLAVVGTSGSGKSSLVRAGLLPALQGGLMASAGSDWRIAVIRPGSDPIGNLAHALASLGLLGSGTDKGTGMQDILTETTLRRSSLGIVELASRARTKLDTDGNPLFRDYENLLIVVDQFEELFRFKRLIEEENSGEDAAAFVKLLLEAGRQKAEKIYIVLTMRSDFLGDCAQFFELPEAINDGQYLIPRMTRDQRREAISGPVAVGKGTISEPLVNQLLNDVGDNPDQLPILQHALMRTWNHWLTHRNGGPMDIPDYEAIGRMAKALSKHADEAYAELSESQKPIAEKLFKGLTEKGTDSREVRRPMEVKQICKLTGASEAAVIAVVEVFRAQGRSFLMPSPTDALTGKPVKLDQESLIDISHESLIRNWERLKTWVDEESHSARIYRRLAETAVLHKEGGAGLWRDPDLGVALAWRKESNPNEVWAKRYHPEFQLAMNFLDESVNARDAQRNKEIKRRRITALIFAIAFVFSVAMGVLAYGQKNRAEGLLLVSQQAEKATKDALEKLEKQNRATEAANLALRDSQKEVEKRAREAVEQRQRAEAQTDLARKNAARAVKETERAEEQASRAQTSTEKALEEIGKNRKLLYASSIGLAQQALEDGNAERAQKLLDRARITPKVGITTNEGRFLSDALIGNGIPTEVHTRPMGAKAEAATPTVWDAINADLRGFEWYYLWRLASRKLATFKLGATVPIQPDSKSVREFGGNPVTVYTARSVAPTAFGSEFPEQFVATGNDNIVRMWFGLKDNSPVKLPPQQEKVKAVAAMGLYQFITADRTAVRVWSLPDPSQGKAAGDEPPRQTAIANLKGNESHIALDVLEDKRLVAIGNGSTFLLWDLRVKEPFTLTEGGAGYPSVSFVEKGNTLITSDGRKLMRWNVLTRESSPIELWENGGEPFKDRYSFFIKSLAFTPDGRTMVTAGNQSFMVWSAANADATAYRLKTELRAHKENFFRPNFFYDLVVAISPDGRMLATGDGTDLINGGGVKVWNISGAEPVELMALSPEIAYATSLDFSSDSRTLAVGSGDALQLWDVSDILLWRAPYTQELSELPSTIKNGVLPDEGLSALSPNGQLGAMSASPDVVEFWNPKSDPMPAWVILGSMRTRAMSFSPDGKLLAVGGGGNESDNGVVTLWDTKSRTQIKVDIKGHQGVEIFVNAVAFSPDNRTLATGATDKTIEVWDISSRPAKLLTPPLEGHKVPLTSVAYSPDGKTLASGDESGTINLWSASSYQLLMTLKPSDDAIASIAFSADSSVLYTRDKKGKILLWHAAPREQVDRLLKQAPAGSSRFIDDHKTKTVKFNLDDYVGSFVKKLDLWERDLYVD